MEKYICKICKKELNSSETYEYRGVFSCSEHFNEVIDRRNFERDEIIKEEKSKTDKFKNLDLGNSIIGKANRKLLKREIEIASKESFRLKKYEKRDK